MFTDPLEFPRVLPPVKFANTEELIKKLRPRVIAPAEKRHRARQRKLSELSSKDGRISASW